MKILGLPVKFAMMNDEELDRLEDLGMSVNEDDLTDGILYVLPHAIASFNEDSEGNVTLNLMNGGPALRIEMGIEEFKKKIQEL